MPDNEQPPQSQPSPEQAPELDELAPLPGALKGTALAEAEAAVEVLGNSALGACLAAIEPIHAASGFVAVQAIVGVSCAFNGRYLRSGDLLQLTIPTSTLNGIEE